MSIGHLDALHPEKWGLVVMEMLRSIAGSDSGEVKVRVNMKPMDEMVIYCDTNEGEVHNIGVEIVAMIPYFNALAQLQPISS